MAHLIDKDALVAEIDKRIMDAPIDCYGHQRVWAYNGVKDIINALEVKEIDEKPNPRFPHYEDIVDKVFGAGNLELWEYEEAEQLVLLAKEELLKDLEVKEVDFSIEVYKYIEKHFNVYDDGNQTLQTKGKKSLIGRVDIENIAKHFFELGLKVQKGEKIC